MATDLSGKSVLSFLWDMVDPHGTSLIANQYRPYKMGSKRGHQHAVINHSVVHAEGSTHTNTIDGFWSLLKRAWYKSNHHYTRHWMPLCVADAVWKYNHRKTDNAFSAFTWGFPA